MCIRDRHNATRPDLTRPTPTRPNPTRPPNRRRVVVQPWAAGPSLNAAAYQFLRKTKSTCQMSVFKPFVVYVRVAARG
eukprot:4016186-Lingulodinium_polyedra.AAC.1